MYMMNCALFNAYVVYNSTKSQKIKYKKFLHNIALYWVTDEAFQHSRTRATHICAKDIKMRPPGRLSMNMRKHVLEKIVGAGKKKIHRDNVTCAQSKKYGVKHVSYVTSAMFRFTEENALNKFYAREIFQYC